MRGIYYLLWAPCSLTLALPVQAQSDLDFHSLGTYVPRTARVKFIAYYPSVEAFRVYQGSDGRIWLEWGKQPAIVRVDPVVGQPFWQPLVSNRWLNPLDPPAVLRPFFDTISTFGQNGERIGLRESSLAADLFLVFQMDKIHEHQARIATPRLPGVHDLVAFEDGMSPEAFNHLLTSVGAEKNVGRRWIALGKEGAAFAGPTDYRLLSWRGDRFHPMRTHQKSRCVFPAWVRQLGGSEPSTVGKDTVAGLAVCSPRRWRAPPFDYRSDPDVWFFGD